MWYLLNSQTVFKICFTDYISIYIFVLRRHFEIQGIYIEILLILNCVYHNINTFNALNYVSIFKASRQYFVGFTFFLYFSLYIIFMVPQWQCISSFVFYIFVTLVPFAVGSWKYSSPRGVRLKCYYAFPWCVVAVTLPI